MNKYFRENESGAALLFSIILISIMLGVGLTLSTIFIGKLRASIDAKSSVGAYYAADTGIEWKLYESRVAPEPIATQLGIGSEFEVVEDIDYIRSLGTYRGVSRAIEVTAFEPPPTGAPPTPTPPTPTPGCLAYTLNTVQSSITSTDITYTVTASVTGTLDGRALNLNAGGDYEVDVTYTRQAADRNEIATFTPDVRPDCPRSLSLLVPKIVITPTPEPQCSDILPALDITVTVQSQTPSTITYTFAETFGRVGTFNPTSPRTYNKGSSPQTVIFSMLYEGLTCTTSETINIPASTPPKYEWVRIDRTTYPGLTGKNNGCGATLRETKVCTKNGQGMVMRMYNVTVGDGIGQGWSETPQAAAVGQAIGSNITYTRFQNCTHAGGASAGPGNRVYECKNTGGPEPAPVPPPAYRWVRIGTQPKAQPHVPAFSLRVYSCPSGSNISTPIVCNSSIENKIAIAEYKATAYVVVADRGAYYQGWGGSLSGDGSTLTLTGRNPATCSVNLHYIFLGAGYQGWNAWQCQKAGVVAMSEPSSFLARILQFFGGLFK